MMTDHNRAMAFYKSALKHNTSSIGALSRIATLYRNQEQMERAVKYFKRVLTIQDTNGEMWSALGHCHLMMEDLQDAYHAYQQALKYLDNPRDPKLWYGIGILYDRYGSLEHAEEAFSAVIKMDSSFEKANEIYFRLGIIYKQQQKYDLSLQCFRYILNSPPRPLTEVDIWYQTGHVYEQQREFERAKEAYERVLAEKPDDAKVLQQYGWLFYEANTSFSSQANAIEYLTRSLKADSNDAQSWYLLGRCYISEQNYHKAYEAYQQAVYRDARNPMFWCSIGVLYYQINQYHDALDAYNRAVRLNPNIDEVWYNLGMLYETSTNQVQDALDAYQRAAELEPGNKLVRQRIDYLRAGGHKSASSQQPGTPVPQDISNPYQYQNSRGPSTSPPPHVEPPSFMRSPPPSHCIASPDPSIVDEKRRVQALRRPRAVPEMETVRKQDLYATRQAPSQPNTSPRKRPSTPTELTVKREGSEATVDSSKRNRKSSNDGDSSERSKKSPLQQQQIQKEDHPTTTATVTTPPIPATAVVMSNHTTSLTPSA
ncbi:hypothetical protein BJV82DRAFT_504241 [Fennellomyces sp. T-0311]|nr:hypothetical protein BJV82DRAFT_504241 [Fennellomyces sp. T-0311]